MYRSFQEIEQKAKALGPKPVAVLFPDDPDIMRAIFDGVGNGLIQPIMVGNKSRIEKTIEETHLKMDHLQIIEESEPQKAADLCIELVKNGRVSFIVKGKVMTSYLYRSLIGHTKVCASDQIPCTLCFHQADSIDKLFIIPDPGVNINPRVSQKKKILKNAVTVLHQLGCKKPKVMALSTDVVGNAMTPSQKDADALKRFINEYETGQCECCEPSNLVDAFSGRDMTTAEFPDIFIVPNIEAGNILVKSIDHLGGGIRQCVTVGGGITVLTPSRSDGYEARILNLSLGVVLAATVSET